MLTKPLRKNTHVKRHSYGRDAYSGDKPFIPLGSRGRVPLGEVSCHRKWKRDTLVGTWNVRSLYRSGSLMAVAKELARYKLDLVGCRKLGGKKRAQ